jgi:hypothetical protein
MRKTLSAVATLLFLLAAPSTVFGQGIFVGGGVTIPTGDFGDFADTGWMAIGGFSFDVGDGGVSAGLEGFYGENKHDTEGDKTNPYGAMAFLLYRAGNPESVGPYLYGGAGILIHKFSSDTSEGGSDTNFGYEFGAGLDFPFGDNVGGWLEGRYMGSTDTTLFGILAGLGFGVG